MAVSHLLIKVFSRAVEKHNCVLAARDEAKPGLQTYVVSYCASAKWQERRSTELTAVTHSNLIKTKLHLSQK